MLLGLGMIIIIVVCVGFLMFMIVLGVMRIRSAHQQRSNEVQMEEKPEMEWDNSALTITVNPMDQDNAYSETEMAGVHGEETDSEDDMSDYQDHDDIDSSEDEHDMRELKGGGLEWDESDLSKYQCKV